LDHLAGSVGLRDGAPAWRKEDAMVRSGTQDGADGQQSLGDLVALAAKDISQLVRYEISLAKSELRMDVRRVGVTAGLAAFAAVIVALIAFVLCFAYAYGLEAAGVPGGLWGAFLFVALTLLVLFLIACGVAYLVVKRVTGMRLTRQSMQGNLEMLRRTEASPDGAGAVIKSPTTAKAAESLGAPAAAEIPAGQLAGVDQDGHAVRIRHPDKRAMDAPFG
jgi:putative superfamily III holin-X